MPRKLPLVRFSETVITSNETVESVMEVTEEAERWFGTFETFGISLDHKFGFTRFLNFNTHIWHAFWPSVWVDSFSSVDFGLPSRSRSLRWWSINCRSRLCRFRSLWRIRRRQVRNDRNGFCLDWIRTWFKLFEIVKNPKKNHHHSGSSSVTHRRCPQKWWNQCRLLVLPIHCSSDDWNGLCDETDDLNANIYQ